MNQNARLKRESQRKHNLGESVRQVIYHLLVAFAPFAAIAGAMAALNTVDQSRKVERLSRHLAEVDGVLDLVRTLADASEGTSPDALARRAAWAFHNMNTVELVLVGNAAREANEKSVADGDWLYRKAWASQSLVHYAQTRRAARIEDVSDSLLSTVCKELNRERPPNQPEKRKQDISNKAKKLCRDKASEIEAILATRNYAAFLRGAATVKALTQRDIVVADGAAQVCDVGKARVRAILLKHHAGFADPPEDRSGEILRPVLASALDGELKRLKEQAETVQAFVATRQVQLGLTLEDFAEEKRDQACARIRAEIEQQVVPPEDLGLLTRPSCGRRAAAIFEEQKRKADEALLVALGSVRFGADTIDAFSSIVRTDSEKATALLWDALLKECVKGLGTLAGSSGLTRERLTPFPEALQAAQGRVRDEGTAAGQKLAQAIGDRISRAGEPASLDPIAAEFVTILAEVGNAVAGGKGVNAETCPTWDRVIAKAATGVSNQPLTTEEKQQLATCIRQALTARASNLQQTVIGQLDAAAADPQKIPSLRDARLKDLQEPRELSAKAKADLLAAHPEARGFVKAESHADHIAGKLTNEVLDGLKSKALAFVGENISPQADFLKLTLEEQQKRSAEIVVNLFSANTHFLKGTLLDVPVDLRDELFKLAEAKLRHAAVPAAIESASLPKGFSPYSADAESKAREAITASVAELTKLPDKQIEEHGESIAKRASLLLGLARQTQNTVQLAAILKLGIDDLAAEFMGLDGEDKKAVEALGEKVRKDLGHEVLSPEATVQLEQRASKLVAERRAAASAAQLQANTALKEADLPEGAIDYPGDKDRSEQALAARIKEVTKTPALLPESQKAMEAKTEELIAGRRKRVQAAQVLQIAARTDADVPDGVLGLASDLAGVEKVISKSILEATGFPVLPDLEKEMKAKAAALLERRAAKTAGIQIKAIEAALVEYEPKPRSGEDRKGIMARFRDEILKKAQPALTEAGLVPEAGKVLDEKLTPLVDKAYAQLVQAERRLRVMLDRLVDDLPPEKRKEIEDELLAGKTHTEPPDQQKSEKPTTTIVTGSDVDRINKAVATLQGIVEGKERVKKIKETIRAMDWAPEWFVRQLDPGDRPIAFEAPNDALEQVKARLGEAGVKDLSADELRNTQSWLNDEFTSVVRWAWKETHRLLESEEAKKVVSEFRESFLDGKNRGEDWVWYRNDEKFGNLSQQAANRIVERCGRP